MSSGKEQYCKDKQRLSVAEFRKATVVLRKAKHSSGVAKHSTAKAKQSSDEHRNGEALN